jgi:hypothetical protein
MDITRLKNIIQSSHINFLFGSGLSLPYLTTLGGIETWLTESESKITDNEQRKLAQASIYAKYFTDVMIPCKHISDKAKYDAVESVYKDFIIKWNEIIAKRNVSLLDKQVNIFTTNIDNFVETAAESCGVEFNDGFKGHLKPIFREDSFSNVVSKRSPLYQNNSLIPVFNYMKMHGSINWISGDGTEIQYDHSLELLDSVKAKLDKIDKALLFNAFKKGLKTEDIQLAVADILTRKKISNEVDDFLDVYDSLVMVNPRKAKFRETVIDLHFYELMRLFSNALEQSSTILMVAGFSFADEHIAKIVARAANTNPTLLILIFAYDDDAKKEIQGNIAKGSPNLTNNNITILSAADYIKWFPDDMRTWVDGLKNFDLASLNKYVFNNLIKLI